MPIKLLDTRFKKGFAPPAHRVGCGCFRCSETGIRYSNKGKKINYPKNRKYDYARTYIICESGCWETIQKLRPTGYAANYRKIYEKQKGTIPDGLVLDHLCRNIKCVNPNHLEPVTFAENVRRGLQATLNKEDVDNIRGLRRWLSQIELAKIFMVHQSTISRIVNAKRWEVV